MRSVDQPPLIMLLDGAALGDGESIGDALNLIDRYCSMTGKYLPPWVCNKDGSILMNHFTTVGDELGDSAYHEVQQLQANMNTERSLDCNGGHHICHSRYPFERLVTEIVNLFPEMAAQPNPRDGCLPLHAAASLGDINVLRVILNKHPQAVSVPNLKGKIPLHYAVREGRLAIVNLLLNENPQTSFCVTRKLKLPLHYAVSEGYFKISKLLLSYNPEGIRAVTSKGKIPLHFAARWGCRDILECMLKQYPDLAQCLDWHGLLPLHDAARAGQTETGKLLIKAYPDGLKLADMSGEIPLFTAIRYGSKELVTEMVRWYPLGAKDVLQQAVAEDRVREWNWDIIELCLKGAAGIIKLYGSKPSFETLQENYQNQGSLQQSSYINIDGHDVYPGTGVSPLLNANMKPVDTPKRQINVSVLLKNLGYGRTESELGSFLSLHVAVECSSSLPILERVLACHSNQASVQNTLGMLPLHIAALQAVDTYGIAVVKQLLYLNPNGVHVKDSRGRLPLHLALLTRAHYVVIEAFLQNFR